MNFNAFRTQVLQNAKENDRKWVYRGHAAKAWKLETGYGRFLDENGQKPFSLDHFPPMLNRFFRRASEVMGESYEGYTLFQKMAMAQHHGLPTPILDWSHSPYVAAYFAVSDPLLFRKEDVDFFVYALEVAGLTNDELTLAEEKELLEGHGEPFRFLDTKHFISRRITRQLGCFTYQNFGECLLAKKQQLNLTIQTYAISDNRSAVLQELQLMGITRGNLFDSLDDVAKEIRSEEQEMVNRRRRAR